MSRNWTAEEYKIILDEWSNDRYVREWAHLLPNRSVEAICTKAKSLGLPKRYGPKIERSISWKIIHRILSNGDAKSCSELVKLSGLAPKTIRDCLKDMHSKRLVHVHGYRTPPTGSIAKLWMLGDSPDKERVKNSRKVKKENVQIIKRQPVFNASQWCRY